MAGSERVYRTAGGGLGDPLAFAAGGGDAAVETICQLQRDERSVFGDPLKEAGVVLARFLRPHPCGH